jgi:peptidylprolyl isomerase
MIAISIVSNGLGVLSMIKKKLIHLFTGLAISLPWCCVHAESTQKQEDASTFEESFSYEPENDLLQDSELSTWEEEATSDMSTSEDSPSLESVLAELSGEASSNELSDTDEWEEEDLSYEEFAAKEATPLTESEAEAAVPQEEVAAAKPAYPEEELIAEGENSSQETTEPELSSITREQTEELFANIDVRQVSEAFGHFIGKNLESPGFEFDVEAVIQGIYNAVAGKPSPMAEEEYEQALSFIQEHAFQVLADQNLEEAQTFLKANASNENVIELEEGKVQYEVQENGTGEPVATSSSPLIHYTGKYLDGTVFGSSQEGEPISVPLEQTIPGLSKAIVGMKEGESRKIYIHPEEGYGTSSHLPPNSLLVFDVKVLKADAGTSTTQVAQHEELSDLEATR